MSDKMRSKPRIGIITADMNEVRTGIGSYIFHIIQELKFMHDLTLIRHESGMDIPGCRSIVIQNRFWNRYNSLIWSWSLKYHHRELMDLDLIHNPGQFLAPHIPGIPSVVTVHDITPVLLPQYHFPFRTWSYRFFFPSIVRGADQIIADSLHTKKDLCSHFQISPVNIHVIYLAADTSYHQYPSKEVEEWREKNGLIRPYILFVGTIEPRKNILTLLKSFSQVASDFPDLDLVIAGRDGWNSGTITTAIRSSEVASKIRYLQYLPDEELPYLYNGASVFVFPSWYEGFGLPPLEAMQSGTPVIASDSSSLPEILGSGCILLNPKDANQFADAIGNILTNESLRKEQIMYGLQHSRQFSWKKTAELTAEVYESVLKGRAK